MASRVVAPSPDRRVFVQIPAYRDPELGPTLIDLFAKARRPESLRVAVLWQRGDEEVLDLDLRRYPNLELIEVSYRLSKGCNWARHELQARWRGESHTLILDSHHRFRRNWDAALFNAYDALVEQSVKKPIVTAYLPEYDPSIDPRGRKNRPLKLYPYQRVNGLLLRLIGRPILDWPTLTGPVPGNFLSLHFLFTEGLFNEDVRFDPDCYFFGDEVSTSIRAFTAGYDIFHPHRVMGWHCYDRSFRKVHWDDHANWNELETVSAARMRTLLSGGDLSGYGAGVRRSLAEFEDRLHLDLVSQA